MTLTAPAVIPGAISAGRLRRPPRDAPASSTGHRSAHGTAPGAALVLAPTASTARRTTGSQPLSLAERATVLPVLLLLGLLSGGLTEARSTATASARAAAARAGGERSARNDAIHWAFIVALFVILALAASLTAAAIIMCARQGGVIDFVVQIDPFRVKVGCKKF